MKLSKQIKKSQKYSGKPKDLPWEVSRMFEIDILADQIAFCREGDYVNIDEAISALEYLLKELKS